MNKNTTVDGECFYLVKLKSPPPRGNKDQRQETTRLQVMQQLNWKYKKEKKNPHTDFPSSCGIIPKDMKDKPFHVLLLIMCLTQHG